MPQVVADPVARAICDDGSPKRGAGSVKDAVQHREGWGPTLACRRGWSSYALAQDLTINDTTDMPLLRNSEMQTLATKKPDPQAFSVLDRSCRAAVRVNFRAKRKAPLIELRPMCRTGGSYSPWRYGLLMRIEEASTLISGLRRARDVPNFFAQEGITMNAAVSPLDEARADPSGRGEREASDQDDFDRPTALVLGLSPEYALHIAQVGFDFLETDEPDQLPIALLSIIEFQHWRTFKDREGESFTSFGAFAAAHEPNGLDARQLERATFLRAFLLQRRLVEVWLDVLEHIVRRPGRPEKLAKGEYSGPVYRLPTGSNAVDRILFRLKRERCDLLDRVFQCEITIQRAAILAGWKKRKPACKIDQSIFCRNGRFRPDFIQNMSDGQMFALVHQLFAELKPDTRSELLATFQAPLDEGFMARPDGAEP